MREHWPKLIGVILLAALVGGGLIMIRQYKVPEPSPKIVVAPVTQTTAPEPVVVNSKYKRDMLGYEDAASTVPPAIAQTPVPVHPPAQPGSRATLHVENIAETLKVASSQLKPGEKISLYYTCYQKNFSPPLSWSGAPSATKSFVVLMEGPDKGRGTPLQWGVYNIPASQIALPEGLPKVPSTDTGMGQAVTELGPVGYSGPCIPKGEVRFVFSVYALDTDLKLPGGVSRDELIQAMNGHILSLGKLSVSHYYRL